MEIDSPPIARNSHLVVTQILSGESQIIACTSIVGINLYSLFKSLGGSLIVFLEDGGVAAIRPYLFVALMAVDEVNRNGVIVPGRLSVLHFVHKYSILLHTVHVLCLRIHSKFESLR